MGKVEIINKYNSVFEMIENQGYVVDKYYPSDEMGEEFIKFIRIKLIENTGMFIKGLIDSMLFECRELDEKEKEETIRYFTRYVNCWNCYSYFISLYKEIK